MKENQEHEAEGKQKEESFQNLDMLLIPPAVTEAG